MRLTYFSLFLFLSIILHLTGEVFQHCLYGCERVLWLTQWCLQTGENTELGCLPGRPKPLNCDASWQLKWNISSKICVSAEYTTSMRLFIFLLLLFLKLHTSFIHKIKYCILFLSSLSQRTEIANISKIKNYMKSPTFTGKVKTTSKTHTDLCQWTNPSSFTIKPK